MQEVIIGREYPQAITELVKNAKQSIKILIYDWRWYSHDQGSAIQKFNNEILQAHRRGVQIHALVNSDFILNPLKELGINVKKINTQKVMHVKMVIVDSKILLIGSHNLTHNAFALNHEISVLFDDIKSVARCENFFENMANL